MRAEDLFQLHERIEIVYVVDGYEATFSTKDGDVELIVAHGKWPALALERLESEMARRFKSLAEVRSATEVTRV